MPNTGSRGVRLLSQRSLFSARNCQARPSTRHWLSICRKCRFCSKVCPNRNGVVPGMPSRHSTWRSRIIRARHPRQIDGTAVELLAEALLWLWRHKQYGLLHDHVAPFSVLPDGCSASESCAGWCRPPGGQVLGRRHRPVDGLYLGSSPYSAWPPPAVLHRRRPSVFPDICPHVDRSTAPVAMG